MTDALVEKVARAIVSANDGDPDFIHGGAPIWTVYTHEARAAILAVLDHFSEPGNVTEKLTNAFDMSMGSFVNTKIPYHPACATSIAAALRAARDEVSRG